MEEVEVIRRRLCDFPKDGAHCGDAVEAAAQEFTLNGVQYSLDLCPKHYTAFDKAITPFVDGVDPIAKKIGKAATRAVRDKTGTFKVKDVRLWLQGQGREIGPTGRIPGVLVEEYKAAHGL